MAKKGENDTRMFSISLFTLKVWNFIWVPHMVAKGPHPYAILAALPGTLAESNQIWRIRTSGLVHSYMTFSDTAFTSFDFSPSIHTPHKGYSSLQLKSNFSDSVYAHLCSLALKESAQEVEGRKRLPHFLCCSISKVQFKVDLEPQTYIHIVSDGRIFFLIKKICPYFQIIVIYAFPTNHAQWI